MKPTLLVLAEAEPPIDWIAALERNQFIIKRYTSEQEFRNALHFGGDLVLLRSSRGQKFLELIARLGRNADGPLPVILVQPKESEDLASMARVCGVSDYLREPFADVDLISSVEACLAKPRGKKAVPAAAHVLAGGERMVGGSACMQDIRGLIARVAATDCNVLITGETGAGKELVADLIHRNSSRRERPFIFVNCAAIPETLLESELFGYEKGAFTGANEGRPGQLELASGGVIFLDEIGELSLHAQAKILRAIEGKEVQRLGRRSGIKVDVRIVCATNRELKADVKGGLFRADLLFRLDVAHIRIPPLRERKEDLRDLAEFYFRELNAAMGLRVNGFSDHSWRSLLNHDWPGNVREFKNVIEASLVQIPFRGMRLLELPEEIHRQYAPAGEIEPTESEKLLSALVCHNWNKSKAAQQLQWSRMTLYRKMAKYQLSSTEKARVQTA